MNHQDRLSKFKLTISSLLPGYLALFDIAALKQYNHHLGHVAGDREIESLGELLQTALGDKRAVIAIGGGQWCVFVVESQIPLLNHVIEEFIEAPEETAKSGWRCEAVTTDGTKAYLEINRDILLRRALRCGFTKLSVIEEFDETLNRIWATIKFLPVNVAEDTSHVTELTQAGWSRIIGELVDTPYYCPFCRKADVEWEECSEDISWGICKGCRAKVKYSG